MREVNDEEGFVGLREWLSEKRDKGVKQVRVTSVLEKLDEAEAAQRPTRSGSGKPRNGKVTITSEDLLGAWEVADLLGVDRTRPSKWKLKGTTFGPDKLPFPEPFRDLKTGPVWIRSQIEPLIPFVEERRRIPASSRAGAARQKGD
jgi:hypothetical protein